MLTSSWEQIRFSGVAGDESLATCDSSCTSCDNCLGGAAICTCTGSCNDGTSPVCRDDAAGPQCECDDGSDSAFTNFWGMFALAWVCCWFTRCARTRSCSAAGSDGQLSSRFRERQRERERREALLTHAVVAAAIAESRSPGNLQRHTPVVQAVPVQASAIQTPAPAVNATLLAVATVDQSVEAPPIAVQVAESSPGTRVLPDPGRDNVSMHTLGCARCGVQPPEPRGNFCANCGAPFGSE